MSDDHEKRIRERAYQLWEDAGRPPGRALEHWVEAERQLEREIASSGGEDRSPAATRRPRKAKETPAEPVPGKAKKAGRSRNGSSEER